MGRKKRKRSWSAEAEMMAELRNRQDAIMRRRAQAELDTIRSGVQKHLQETTETKPNEPVKTNQVTMNDKSYKLKQTKEFEGIITCIFEHEVVKTTACYEWSGPKFSREMWNDVLAFFRWTYETTKSECQVRLFVNYRTREWRAWAFPQEESTGMTTKEIDNDDTKIQRAQFGDQDGWLYYGTVHHHCAGTASQSSVDTANEQNQDGIHITVGKINTGHYDIHARLYQSGYRINDFDISEFWDTNGELANLPEHVRKMLPDDALQVMAKHQMCIPPPADHEFPAKWKENLIQRPKPVMIIHNSSPYPGYNQARTFFRLFTARSAMETDFDGRRCLLDLEALLEAQHEAVRHTHEDLERMAEHLDKLLDLDDLNLLDVLLKNDVRPDHFIKLLKLRKKFYEEKALEKELEEEMLKKNPKAKGKVKQLGNGTSTKEADLAQSHMDYEGGHYAGYGGGFGMGG